MASKTDRSFPSPMVRNVIRRFHPTGDAQSNDQIATDPDAMEMVSEEVLSEVGYKRPPFNWPAPSIPQANYFVIEGMALDVLKQAGYAREARSLRTRLEVKTPAFDELAGLIHRTLDFAPAPPLPADKLAELAALAEQMGLDPDSLGRAKKRRLDNPLAHSCKTMREEWDWLVGHAKMESCFGKTAACELSGQAISKLAARWLPTIGEPARGDPKDPSFGNRAWFDEQFPMGWIHVDHLGETACVSAPMAFEDRVALMAYEIASKAERGWPERDVRRFGFDHKSSLGVTGSAVVAMEAFEFFKSRIAPSLGKAPAAEAAPSALNQHMRRCNPAMAGIDDASAVWTAYGLASPEGCAQVERAWFESRQAAAKSPHEAAKAQALAEKHALSLHPHAQFMKPGSMDELPDLPKIQARMRL